ncbi:MAG: TPM domain-containing protein [Chitinophagales bacterium]
MNKLSRFLLIFMLLLTAGWKFSMAIDIPARPDPPKLVNDFAGMMSREQADQLERKLDDYSDSTSTQIAVVTLVSLEGSDITQTAYRIGDAWGVGGKNQDNGIVILLSKEDRDVWIATGKGLEGPVPDVTAKKIIDNIMLPNFRNGDFYTGLDQGTDAIIKLAAGEFVDELGDQQQNDKIPFIPIIIIVIIIIFIISRNNRGRGGRYMSRGGTFTPWIWGGGLGGFGGGGHSGGGGGFGGFGGGSFGGGGAGGSW